MKTPSLRILNLYPRQMNLYGDAGNLLVLQKRCEWRDIAVSVVHYEPGDALSAFRDIDMIIGGGGQESGQMMVKDDLRRSAPHIREQIEDDVVALVVCASFQLFGSYYDTAEGERIEGAGVFTMHSLGQATRQIGNCIVRSTDFGDLVGYENHSGKTFLQGELAPLGEVVSGYGNNGEDKTEGARYRNALGTYLHGPLLPKNPLLADYLIATALERRTGQTVQLSPLPDTWVESARKIAMSRPR